MNRCKKCGAESLITIRELITLNFVLMIIVCVNCNTKWLVIKDGKVVKIRKLKMYGTVRVCFDCRCSVAIYCKKIHHKLNKPRNRPEPDK